MREYDPNKPYEGCLWDCTYHRGASGCLRRANDPNINDDFCVGKHICMIEWEDANTCKTCVNKDNKNLYVCKGEGGW